MWVKTKAELNLIDSKIIKEGFIVSSGSVPYSDKENPFKRDTFVNFLRISKAHKNYPLAIRALSMGCTDIYPINTKNKMPGEVYANKNIYDSVALVLLPYLIKEIKIGEREKTLICSESFLSINNNQKSEVSLVYRYAGYPFCMERDFTHIAFEVQPSQVGKAVYEWLTRKENVYSHEKTFEQKLEGWIDIPAEQAREKYWCLIDMLENRFKTRLSFPKYDS